MNNNSGQQKATFKHIGIRNPGNGGALLRRQPKDVKRMAALAVAGKTIAQIAKTLNVSTKEIKETSEQLLGLLHVDDFSSSFFTTREARRALQQYMPEPELPY